MGERIDKAKGKIKQAVAGVTRDKKLKREGQRDEIKGNLKGAVADSKGAVKKTVKGAKRAVKDVSERRR